MCQRNCNLIGLERSRGSDPRHLIGWTISCSLVAYIETTGYMHISFLCTEVVIDRNNSSLSLFFLGGGGGGVFGVLPAKMKTEKKKGEKGWGKMAQRLSSSLTRRADLSYCVSIDIYSNKM